MPVNSVGQSVLSDPLGHIDFDSVKNEFGNVRRNKVLWAYRDGLISLSDVVSIYRDWRDTAEYMAFCELRPYSIADVCNDPMYSTKTSYEYTETRYHFSKCPKRGNDVYKRLLGERFGFLDGLPPIHFFTNDRGVNYSPMLFVTLSYGHRKCLNLKCGKHFAKDQNKCTFCGNLVFKDIPVDIAWGGWECNSCGELIPPIKRKKLTFCPNCFSRELKKFGVAEELHKFESNLRKQFGHFVKIRVWESFDNCYPHCHVVYYFTDHVFRVSRHVNNKGHVTWRIPYKQKEKIAGYWHSNVDVQACQDTLGSFSEVCKYITKDVWSDKYDKTNAMIWLFGKQSYHISSWSPYTSERVCPNCESLGHGVHPIRIVSTPDIINRVYGERLPYVFGNDERQVMYMCSSCCHVYNHDDVKTFRKIELLRNPGDTSKACGNYKKDFVGAVWGYDAWRELYKQHHEGLREPNFFDLVDRTLSNCNRRFMFLGIVSGKSLGIRGDIHCFDCREPPPLVLDELEVFRKKRCGIVKRA